MAKHRWQFFILSAVIFVILSLQKLPTKALPGSLPIDWPPLPLTQAQIETVKACALEKNVNERYPEAMKVTDLETTFQPKSACDWATLAYAYAKRVKHNEPLPESAKSAFLQTTLRNLGFALATPVFYGYFDNVKLVKALPQSQQNIRNLEITYRWSGLGNAVNYILKIQQANTTPIITVTGIPGMFNLYPNSEKVFATAMKTNLDSEKVQALRHNLQDFLPVQAKFDLLPCFDNYPHWEVMMTFEDNSTLNLTTDSNFLHMGGPWFTEIAQQSYIQYSSTFAKALHDLVITLGLPVGQPAGMYCARRSVFEQAFPEYLNHSSKQQVQSLW
jgi:hypothetical protein